MKGRWAAGIEPKQFMWIINDCIAVCERPGGVGSSHRKVRRVEEILWIKNNHFDKVVSICPEPFNLHAYDELGLPFEHVPIDKMKLRESLQTFYKRVAHWLSSGERVIVHADLVSDTLLGAFAGFMYWARYIDDVPKAIHAMELLSGKSLGGEGRKMVVVAAELDRPQTQVVARPKNIEPAPEAKPLRSSGRSRSMSKSRLEKAAKIARLTKVSRQRRLIQLPKSAKKKSTE